MKPLNINTSMKYKFLHISPARILVYSACLPVFLFWAFLYPYHTVNIEQTSFFLFDSSYLSASFLKPGGIADCLGNFLAQLYINLFAAAFLQTLFFALVATLAQRIAALSRSDATRLCGCLFPSLLLFVLQCDQRFTPACSLVFVFYFAALYIYNTVGNRCIRFTVFTLMTPGFYLLMGGGLLCALYAGIALCEIVRRAGVAKYFSMIGLAAAALFPRIWQGLYLTADENLYSILPYESVGKLEYIPLLLTAFTPAVVLLMRFVKMRSKRLSLSVNILLPLLLTAYLIPASYSGFREQKLGMYYSTVQGDWDRVLAIRKNLKQSDELADYMSYLALAVKGELPEKLFDYPRDKGRSLFLQRDLEQSKMLYGSEFYYQVGLYNEAIHWIFEASAESGMNRLILNSLSLWNEEAGYSSTAETYRALLDRTLFRRNLSNPKRDDTRNAVGDTAVKLDFFIGGRETISDLARHLDNNPSSRITIDYMLCELLLKKDFQKFSRLFEICYDYRPEVRLPKAYSEAFMILAAVSNNSALINRASAEVRSAYADYMQLYQSSATRQIKEKYSNTLWYHVHFVK